MIDLKPLIHQVDLALTDWAMKLDTHRQDAVYERLQQGAAMFIEVIHNPDEFAITPQIRIGMHDPERGQVYLDNFHFVKTH